MDKEICVRADMGESQTIKTMIHEVAHAMLHDSDQMKQRGEEKTSLPKKQKRKALHLRFARHLALILRTTRSRM